MGVFSEIIFHRFDLFRYISDSPPQKKYVDINGNISEDKRQSMLRYLARYVDIPFSKGQGRVPGRTLTCPLSRQGNSTENCN